MTDADSEAESRRQYPTIDRIGHELRTPLTVVIGMCELLHNDLPHDDSLKELAARVAANAWHLHAVVERLISELHQAGYMGPDELAPLQPDNSSQFPGPDSSPLVPRNQ